MENTKIMLSDIAGYENEKKEAAKIIDILVNHEKYERLGASIPKGLLLAGPSGTGKTMLAKAIANEANVPLYEFEACETENQESTVRLLKDQFRIAKENSPSILFIDELDELVSGSEFQSDYSRKMQKILLTEIDGISSSNGVLVIATTNYKDCLPPALLRSGRIDKHIEFSKPDVKSRRSVFDLYLAKNESTMNVDGSLLASKTADFSCADIKNLINDTIIDCVSRKVDITTNEMEEHIAAILFKDIKRNEEEIPDTVCYHEIGHFLVGYSLTNKLGDIVCEKYGNRGGFVRYNEDVIDFSTPSFGRSKKEKLSVNPYENITKNTIINQLAINLGGMAAEELLVNNISSGSSSDLSCAKKYIRYALTSGCFGFKYPCMEDFRSGIISRRKLERYEAMEAKLLAKAYKLAKKTVMENQKYVDVIFKELKAKKRLTTSELTNLLAIA